MPVDEAARRTAHDGRRIARLAKPARRGHANVRRKQPPRHQEAPRPAAGRTGPRAAEAAGRMGPRRVTRKRPPGQQPKAGAKKRLQPRDRRPRADDEPDAHSPRLLKIDPDAVKLYRTEALNRLDVVANARLKTRFRQFRVRALALSTGVLTASTTRARSPNSASGSSGSSPSRHPGISWKTPW